MTKKRPARPARRPARRGRPAAAMTGPARRRARLLVVAGFGFAAVVLGTSLPVSALLTQRSQLSTASAALAQAQSANQSLSRQVHQLSNAGTVSGLARTDYGLVAPGQKEYVILPPAGASPSVVSGSGHVPLNGAPVTPGSARSRQLLGLPGSTASGPGTSSSNHKSRPHPTSFWGRVARTLEFWR